MNDGGGETQETKLPGYLKKPAIGISQGIRDLSPQEYYPDQTYAGMSDYTEQGIQALGMTDYDPTMDYYKRTLEGGYLGLSPEYQNAVMNPAMEAVANRFNMAGRYGSPGSQYQMAEAGMQALAPYYNAERGRQQQAAALFPTAQREAAGAQLAAGGLTEGWDQKAINEAMARYYWDPNYQNMLKQAGLLGVLPGGNTGTVTTVQPGGSPLAGAAGGAFSGASVGASAGPYGALAGGILGGVGGYLQSQ